jgi:hypothetical protein
MGNSFIITIDKTIPMNNYMYKSYSKILKLYNLIY